MGLGLCITGKVSATGLLRPKPGPKAVLRKIEDAVKGIIEDPLEQRLLRSQ